MTDLQADQEMNRVLDRILVSRRTIRSFTSEAPPKETIQAVLNAGLLAPYAALALSGQTDFRRFVVIRRGSSTMTRTAELFQAQVGTSHRELEIQMEKNPFLRKNGEAFLKRLEIMSRQGVPGVGSAPYFIVVAERKGFPPIEQQSLAHCLQNMWLKATALGLGFQLISLTAQMAKNEDFCRMLRVPYGEFELNGCAVGYPDSPLPPLSRPAVDDVSYWPD